MAKIYKIILFFLFLAFIPFSAKAATLSFSPVLDSYAIGSTFSVNIYVGSSDQSMNAVSGVISFPWDKLQVISISKTGSVLSLWAEEPSFSNSLGTVNFEGIVLNPGFSGAQGKVLSITFKTKNIGQANLSFSSGSVLANDGTGTNILNNLGIAVVNVGNQTSNSSTLNEQKDTTLGASEKNAPVVTSLTHSDQSMWYANNNPEFFWILPKGSIEIRTGISKNPASKPAIISMPAISNKKFNKVADGVSYFSLQIHTASGWGAIARYRVNIDTTPPKAFSVTFPHGKNSLEPQPVILFDTTDTLSGISHYEVKIGDGGPERTAPIALSNPYPLPPQNPGSHVVTVTAFDRVGNTTTASSDFTIEAIDVPVITSYPEEINFDDIVKIRGTTYPDSDLEVFFYQDKKIIHQESSRSNSLGDFSIIVTKRFAPGAYNFTAQVTDGRGAKSKETNPLTIVVKSKFLADVAAFIMDYFSGVILILLVIGGVIGVGIFTWYKFSRLIRRLRDKTKETEHLIDKSFDLLRKDISSHVARLKTAQITRKLTSEEVIFLEEFEEELEDAKDVVEKKVEDISN
ncbi:hypothetical protein HY311_01490 [Candidatus Nomurabacteria bacterium]|nr:hypothetical protein [Candidatus Nomurabacteria bacterium]